MKDLHEEIDENIDKTLDSFFTEKFEEGFKKQLKTLYDPVFDDFLYWLMDDARSNYHSYIQQYAHKYLEAVVRGDEKAARYLFGEDNYTGRDKDHRVIHGELFEYGPIVLRRKIVEAHTDLLKNGRILDLEDQVASRGEGASVPGQAVGHAPDFISAT